MPNDHAGFAAAITIRIDLFNDLLRAAFAGGAFPHRYETDRVVEAFLQFKAAVTVGQPTVQCDPASQTLDLQLRSWGDVRIGGDAEDPQRPLLNASRMRLVPHLDFSTTGGPRGLRFKVIDPTSTFTILDGLEPFPPAEQLRLVENGPKIAADVVGNAIGSISLARLTESFPATEVGLDPTTTGVVRVFDDALVIGLDRRGSAGDPSALRPFGADALCIALSPGEIEAAFAGISQSLQAQLTASGNDDLTFESLRIEPLDGALRARALLRAEHGTLDLFATLSPKLANQPGRVLVFDVSDVDFDVDGDVTVASVLDAIVSVFTESGDNFPDFEAVLKEGFAANPTPAESTFLIDGTGHPKLTARLESIIVDPSGMNTSTSLSVDLPNAARITGPVTAVMGRRVSYFLNLPIQHVGDDPRLDIVWSIDAQPLLDGTLAGPSTGPSTGPRADRFGSIGEASLLLSEDLRFKSPSVEPVGGTPGAEFAGGFVDLGGVIADFPPLVDGSDFGDLEFTTDFLSGPLSLLGQVTVSARATRTLAGVTEAVDFASLAVQVVPEA